MTSPQPSCPLRVWHRWMPEPKESHMPPEGADLPRTPSELWKRMEIAVAISDDPVHRARDIQRAEHEGRRLAQCCGPTQWSWIREAVAGRALDHASLSAPDQSSRRQARPTQSHTINAPEPVLDRWLTIAARLPAPLERPENVLDMMKALAAGGVTEALHQWMLSYWPTTNLDGILHQEDRWGRLLPTRQSAQQRGHWMTWSHSDLESLATICRQQVLRASPRPKQDWFASRLLEIAPAEEVGLPEEWDSLIETAWPRQSERLRRFSLAPPIPIDPKRDAMGRWFAKLGIKDIPDSRAGLSRTGLLGRPDWTEEALHSAQARCTPQEWGHCLTRITDAGPVGLTMIEEAIRDDRTELAVAATLAARWDWSDKEEQPTRMTDVLLQRLAQTPATEVVAAFEKYPGRPLFAFFGQSYVARRLPQEIIRAVLAHGPLDARLGLVGALAESRGVPSKSVDRATLRGA